jgi:hypothetical protein
MSLGWNAKAVKKNGVADIGASVTNVAISEEFSIYAGGAMNGLVLKLKCAGVTAGAGITAKLQSAINGDYVDSKTVAITANGDFYITLHAEKAADQTYFPLLASGRVVITTGAGSAVTISSIYLLQEL